MYNGNSRFEELGGGVVTELISSHTQLFYDPTTQRCRVMFNGSPYMPIPQADGSIKYVPVGNQVDILNVELNDKMEDFICPEGDIDPVSGIDLSQVSVTGVLILMKRAYDKFHNENYLAVQAQIAAAQAAAEAAAAAAAAEQQAADQHQTPPPEEPTP